ncbi:MAG: lytic murein transglycosylase [Mangrovicoccus sp.]
MRTVFAIFALCLSVSPLQAGPHQPIPRPQIAQFLPSSPRPLARPMTGEERLIQASVTQSGFEDWVEDFKRRARSEGIRASIFERAFAGVRYDAEVIRLDRHQSEFSKTMGQYLETAVSANRINSGRAALAQYPQTFAKIEARYGVEKEVVAAIWGLESAYGGFRGNSDVIRSLATLAYDGRRGAFFEEQLIAALKILQAGDVSPRAMTGSWAGAMGHTQFMPSSYLDYAVDFTGDGRRDIWSNDPTDALASTAAYLARHGWRKGLPWGVEVALPPGFDYALTGHGVKRSARQWAKLGVRRIGANTLPDLGQSSILVPGGAGGPALMISSNFNVIERYNAADSYVIAVGHLSDRMRGAGGFRAAWPNDERGLKTSERKELQARLTAAGYSTQGVDGRIGPNTIDAIRKYQAARGLTPDGYPSLSLLQRLR